MRRELSFGRQRRTIVLVLALTLMLILAGALFVSNSRAEAQNAHITSTVPSSSQARAVLSLAYEASSSGDTEKLCNVAAATRGNCEIALSSTSSRPVGAPEVRCEGTISAAGDFSAGRILRVSGTANDGSNYESDVLVIATESGERMMNPVFWTGTHAVASGGQTIRFEGC